MPATAQGGSL